MRHRSSKKVLSRKSAARKALVRGLATSLVLYGKIRTTEAKAKVLRPVAERLVTTARVASVTHRRRLLQTLTTEAAVIRLIQDIAPRFKNRHGGYTRISKVGPRQGDGAHMVQIEFCE